jgi:hypothetical protein
MLTMNQIEEGYDYLCLEYAFGLRVIKHLKSKIFKNQYTKLIIQYKYFKSSHSPSPT